jgi:hypothetical protein
MKRKNKTYRNQPTKHHKTQKSKQLAIAVILSSLFTLSAINAITDAIQYNRQRNTTTNNQTTINNILIDDLTIINYKTENEKIAYLSVIQACDKHLPATTYGKTTNDNCINDLIAIAHQENRTFSHNTKGADSYQSYGLYQISLYYHPQITIAQANDPYFAADWTLRRLINNGYLTGSRDYAIMKHNGTPNIPATLKYLAGVNNYITNNLINN